MITTKKITRTEGDRRTIVWEGYKKVWLVWTYPYRIYYRETITQQLVSDKWQDIDRIWLEVDRVYETRWDCMAVPGGARQAA